MKLQLALTVLLGAMTAGISAQACDDQIVFRSPITGRLVIECRNYGHGDSNAQEQRYNELKNQTGDEREMPNDDDSRPYHSVSDGKEICVTSSERSYYQCSTFRDQRTGRQVDMRGHRVPTRTDRN